MELSRIFPLRKSIAFSFAIAAAGLPLQSVRAQTIQKDADGTNLTLGGSWVGDAAPGATNTALFDSLGEPSGIYTVPSGNPTWGAIQITNPTGPISISVGTGTWTIAGNAGATTPIDMSVAEQDLTISGSTAGRVLRLGSAAASYTLNIAFGRIFTIGTNLTLAAQSGSRTVTVAGGGDVIVHGSLSGLAGNTTVSVSNGTIGGNGTITPLGTGIMTVGASGSIAPGSAGTGIGTLTIDSAGSAAASVLSLNSSATFKMELGTGGTFAAPGSSDLLTIANSVANDVVFNNNTVDFRGTGSVGVFKLFDGLASADPTMDTWNGLTVSGQQIVGGLSATNLASGFTGTFYLGDGATTGDAGDIYLEVIPEPASAALLLGGAACVLGLRRIRRGGAETSIAKAD